MTPSEQSAPRTPGSIVRSMAAFVLNLLVASLGPGFEGSFVHRFLRVHGPAKLTIAERELVVSIAMAALIAFCVCRFWRTTTAKWVWIPPLLAFAAKVTIFRPDHIGGGVMEDGSYGLWRHFFNPDPTKGSKYLAEYMDFFIFTAPTVRATTYSLVAWVSQRLELGKVENSVVAPAAETSGPTAPAIWTSPKGGWLTGANLLITISVAVFFAMVASGVSPLFARTDQLAQWGANRGSLTLHGQGWRLITSSFLHLEVFHLIMNMVCLWWICRLAERIFGGFGLIGIYLLTAIGAGLSSLAWNPERTSAGASGAIFGIAGALLAVAYYGKFKLPKTEIFYRRITIFILYSLITGLNPGVDNMAHLGGLAGGLVLGFVFTRFLRIEPAHAIFAPANLFQAREALERHAYDSAVEHLQNYIAARPKAADGHALLAYSLHTLGRHDEATQEYELAMNLGCVDEAIKTNLAAVHQSESKSADAGAAVH